LTGPALNKVWQVSRDDVRHTRIAADGLGVGEQHHGAAIGRELDAPTGNG